MSKKRTSAESNDDEQQNEGSDSLFQEENNAKRAKLASLSDTTLQNLPMELIELILIKVVVMEVKGMKLAKSVWKEKADLVINRLTAVCSYWSRILTTDFFRNELHRTLDTTAQQMIRLEILNQVQIPFIVFEVTTMKDEIFMISSELENIVVYNRNNMARLKDVNAPEETILLAIAGCNVSNCLYALGISTNDGSTLSVLRFMKDELRQQFNISPWMNCPGMLLFPSISVSTNGSIIIFSGRQGEDLTNASIYDVNGNLQHKIMLFAGICQFRVWTNALLKSNGNLVFLSINGQVGTELTEIDATGRIERKYQSSVGVQNGVHFADVSGRYVISESDNRIRLLDSELNLLDFNGPQLNGNELHYNSQRNEVVSTLAVGNNTSLLTIFRFLEE